MIKNRKAAMEMSMGTIVTIVLLMTVLILGLVLVRTIFSSAETSIVEVDKAVKNEIQSLFDQDDSKKIVTYPATGLISIKKGGDQYRGFAFQIRNTGESAEFSYKIEVNDDNIQDNCNIRAEEANSWIKLGGSGTINMGAGELMEKEEFVRFLIPDSAPICAIRYGITVEKNGEPYGSTASMDLEILPE